MTERPILTPFNLVLAGLLALVTLAGFFIVPLDAALPIHWNLEGVADGFAPAPFALLIPSFMAVAIAALFLVLRRTGLKKDMEAGRHVIPVVVSVIFCIAILLICATIAIGIGYSVDMPRIIVCILAAMLIVLGNYLPKSQPNRVAGVRLPWTLRDPANWTVTNRWTGRLMMLGGGIALLAAVIGFPPVALIVVALLVILLPIIAGTAISFVLARR